MALIRKLPALLRHDIVPVFCDRCGAATHLSRVDEDTAQCLIATGYYRSSVRELDLLQRTERLFARFPHSRHLTIVQHLHLNGPDAADEEFDRALREDKELQAFLQMGFLLPVRLKAVQESVTSSSKSIKHYRVPCRSCHLGGLFLKDTFFERLGSHADDGL